MLPQAHALLYSHSGLKPKFFSGPEVLGTLSSAPSGGLHQLLKGCQFETPSDSTAGKAALSGGANPPPPQGYIPRCLESVFCTELRKDVYTSFGQGLSGLSCPRDRFYPEPKGLVRPCASPLYTEKGGWECWSPSRLSTCAVN